MLNTNHQPINPPLDFNDGKKPTQEQDKKAPVNLPKNNPEPPIHSQPKESAPFQKEECFPSPLKNVDPRVTVELLDKLEKIIKIALELSKKDQQLISKEDAKILKDILKDINKNREHLKSNLKIEELNKFTKLLRSLDVMINPPKAPLLTPEQIEKQKNEDPLLQELKFKPLISADDAIKDLKIMLKSLEKAALERKVEKDKKIKKEIEDLINSPRAGK